MGHRPFIVGMGGTTRAQSGSESVLRLCLRAAERLGARTQMFAAQSLDMPMYGAAGAMNAPNAARLVQALRECDGVILSTPAYHGVLSGLLKNALDYAEELRGDVRPYLDGRAVGCIVCAYGPQAMGTTLVSLRSIVHALRAWPTSLGVCINSAEVTFSADGQASSPDAQAQLAAVARQVVDFAHAMAAMRTASQAAQ